MAASKVQLNMATHSTITIAPFRVRLWRLNDRFASEINETSCKAEIESIAAHGQRIPAIGRPLLGDPEHEIELICGARRLFAARLLKKPLLVEVRAMSDREGLIAMDIENRHRQDMSPYEHGLSYRRWLASGHFSSQEEIARELNISPSKVSRLIQLARMPAVVVDAFRSPSDIRENWGTKLVEALEDPQRRAATLRSARALSDRSPRAQGIEVIRKLLAFSPRGRRLKRPAHDKVVTADDGTSLFRIRYLNDSISLIFREENTSQQSLARIEDTLAGLLQSSGDIVASDKAVRPQHM